MASKALNSKKIKLSNSITYGIGANDSWGILRRSGNLQLHGVQTEYLIAENLDIQNFPSTAITKIIGDGHGNYGISITLTSENKPVTHATVINNEILEQVLVSPSSLAEAFREYFHLDSEIVKHSFGLESSFLLSHDLYSRIVGLSAKIKFLRSPISIKIPNYSPETVGMFEILSLIWNLLPRKSRTRIFAIYPIRDNANYTVLLLSSRKFSHASIAFASATNFHITNHHDNILKIRYLSFFDFLRSLWPF